MTEVINGEVKESMKDLYMLEFTVYVQDASTSGVAWLNSKPKDGFDEI